MNRRTLTDGKPIQVLSNSYMTVRRLYVIVKGTIGMILRKTRVNIAGPQSNHCESTVSINPSVTQILWYSIETMTVYKHQQQRPLLILKIGPFLKINSIHINRRNNLSPDEPVMRLKKARETNDLSLESYLDALYTFTHA